MLAPENVALEHKAAADAYVPPCDVPPDCEVHNAAEAAADEQAQQRSSRDSWETKWL